MKITRVDTIPIRVPLNPELAIKSGRGGAHTVSPFLLVKILTDEGAVGVGEASCTPRWSGEDQVSAGHFINSYFAPLLVGEDPTRVEEMTAKFVQPVAGNYFTKSAVEMALWDLAGKAAGKPVYELLGGKVRESVGTKWSVSGQAPEKAAEIARWAAAQGFRKMKVKVGISPESDVARAAAVRGVVGPEVKLGCDANGGWGTAEVAIEVGKRLVAESGVYFVEQPVPAGDAGEMARVREAVGVPVIADESVYTLADARVLARSKACDVFSIYVGKAGGILPAKRVAEFAQSVGMVCTVGSNLELGVGSAAMAHLAMACRGVDPERYPCDIIGPFYYESDIVTAGIDLRPGRVAARAVPGLGVELDEDKVRRYRVV